MIDSGSGPNAKISIAPKIKALLKSNQLRPQAIINTHSHVDHSGGNGFLRRLWKSKILAHEAEANYVTDRLAALRDWFGRYAGYFPTTDLVQKDFMRESGPSCPVDRRLGDGSTIEVGDFTLEVIHSPGHSKGSVCLYEPKKKLLFAGDCVQGRGVRADFATLPIYDDLAAYGDTLAKLSKIDASKTFLGHPFLPAGRTVLTGREFHRLINESLKMTSEIDRTIKRIRVSRDEPDLLKVAREISMKFGWSWSDSVPVFVLATVESHLRTSQ